jgi:hypothetical protein
MAFTVQGGASRVDFFTVSADHTNVGTTAAASFQLIEQTAPTRGDDGGWTISWTQLQDDPDFYDFVDTYAPTTEASGGEEVTLENGDVLGGSTINSPDLVCLVYGPKISSAPEKRKTLPLVVKVASSSGSFNQVNGSFSKPTLEAISQKAKADININTLYASTLCSTGALVTLSAGSKGKVVFALTT